MLNVPRSPNVPHGRPARLAPSTHSCLEEEQAVLVAEGANDSSAAGLPRMLTAITIRVRGPARSSFNTSMLRIQLDVDEPQLQAHR